MAKSFSLLRWLKENWDYFWEELVLPERTGKPWERKVSGKDIFLIIIALSISILLMTILIKIGKFISSLG